LKYEHHLIVNKKENNFFLIKTVLVGANLFGQII